MPMKSPVTDQSSRRRRLEELSAKMSPNIWRLSEADREYLAVVASTAVEYVHDRKFTHSRAEKQFGQAVVPDKVSIFSCFNYARFRVYNIFLDHEGGTVPLNAIRSLLVWSRRADSLRNTIVDDNYGLVISMMKRSGNLGRPDEDEMRSDGSLALTNSVNGFDPNKLSVQGKPIRFSTYSCRAILKALARAGSRAGRRKGFFPTSYDPTMEMDDSDDTRRDEAATNIAAEVLRIVQKNLAGLNGNEEIVIRKRFFSDARDGKGMTLEDIGKLLGISKERVRQIEGKAKEKIRGVLEHSL